MIALEVANSTSLVAGPAAAALLDAFAHGNIALSFSMSGFLISYFAGIYAILSQLGVIDQSTKIAGASSGGLIALAHCSGLADRLPEIVADLSDRCRRRANCQTSLDRGVREMFQTYISADAYQHCTNVAYISITTDKFPHLYEAENVLVSNFRSNNELVDAAAATSYIPMWSGRNLTTKFDGRESYDGFFSNPQPCPPDVGYCIRINSANPPWSNQNWSPLLRVMANAASLYTGRKARLASTPQGGFSVASLNTEVDARHPNITAFEQAAAADLDIAPGIWSDTAMSQESWYDLVVLAGDAGIQRHLYRLGRQDARAWADATGLAAAARAKKPTPIAVSPSRSNAARTRGRGAQTAGAAHTAAVAAGTATVTAAEAAEGRSSSTYRLP